MTAGLSNSERDRWILSHRPSRNTVDPHRPYAFHVEEERSESGEIVKVATIFLTNRECPWKCLMCDLWKNTLTETVPLGAIPEQIDFALAQLNDRVPAGIATQQLKLYNSGSFFDPNAIPVNDYEAIAQRVRGFERIIVECHPSLVGERCVRFRDLLNGSNRRMAATPRLEVAMGLETAHPEVLEKLNKRMTLEQFSAAASFLSENGIALRCFVLVKPPFMDEEEGLNWTKRSLDFAFRNGATVVSLIPTRPGNGALEILAKQGEYSPPGLRSVEDSLIYGIGLRKGRVFVDLWDIERFSKCPKCFPARSERLRRMNLSQEILPIATCSDCGNV